MARISPVRIPGADAGNTTRRIVCHLDAPHASDPSRTPRGTADSDSSVDTMTTGTVIKASVSAAHRIPPVPKVGVGKILAEKKSIDRSAHEINKKT